MCYYLSPSHFLIKRIELYWPSLRNQNKNIAYKGVSISNVKKEEYVGGIGR